MQSGVSPSSGTVTLESLTAEITSAVAEAEGVDPLDLDPLYDYVDVEALVALFDSMDGPSLETFDVSFTFEGCLVELASERTVEVTPLTQSE